MSSPSRSRKRHTHQSQRLEPLSSHGKDLVGHEESHRFRLGIFLLQLPMLHQTRMENMNVLHEQTQHRAAEEREAGLRELDLRECTHWNLVVQQEHRSSLLTVTEQQVKQGELEVTYQ